MTLLDPKLDFHAVRAGEFSIRGLLAILGGQAERIGARLVIIDAIDVLMRLCGAAWRSENLRGRRPSRNWMGTTR